MLKMYHDVYIVLYLLSFIGTKLMGIISLSQHFNYFWWIEFL